MTWVPFSLAVPGSTSNLGPGFDTLGLALALYLHVRVTSVEEDGRAALTCDFGDVTIPGENLIARAYGFMAKRHGRACPSLRVEVRTEIPLQAGLGSSAAAIVAGLRLYEAVTGPCALDELLATASHLEGHPDNTSASLLGGLTVSAVGEQGRVVALAAPWPDQVQVIVATPRVTLETTKARDVLPPSVPRPTAVFNVQRVALLLQALHTGRLDRLRDALEDRLHQPFRAPLVPGLYDALQIEHPALLGVFLSGAGPSIAALAAGDAPAVVQLFDELYGRLGIACDVRTVAIHQPIPVRDAMPAQREPVDAPHEPTRTAPPNR